MSVSSLEKKEGLSDYCILGGDDQHRLSDVERMTLVGGSELIRLLDRISRDKSALRFDSIARDLDPALLTEAAAYYSDTTRWSTPNKFFTPPSGIIAPKITPIHGLPDGEISDVEFHSVFEGHHENYKKVLEVVPENKVVHARYWKHNSGLRPTIIAVHGWTMGDQRTNSLAFLPGLFYRLGLDIVLLELPFHGRRLSSAFREVGHSLFPSGNVMITNEAIAQSISDLRQLRLILKALGVKEIGCVGMSLGAYIASLWASLDALSFVIPMVPMASLSEMAWRVLGDSQFQFPNKDKISEELLEQIFSIHSPLCYEPKTKSGRALIIAGEGDCVIPRSHPEKLAKHLSARDIVWFSGNHDLSGDRDKVFSSIHVFLDSLGLLVS